MEPLIMSACNRIIYLCVIQQKYVNQNILLEEEGRENINVRNIFFVLLNGSLVLDINLRTN